MLVLETEVTLQYACVMHKCFLRLNITNIDVRTEIDDKESLTNWTQYVTF